MRGVDRSLTSVIKFCDYCQKKEHIKKNCYRLQNKIKKLVANQKRMQSETSGETNVVGNCLNDVEFLVISNSDSKFDEKWILNTACTFLMCPNRDLFTTFETVSNGVVVMLSNEPCKIAGIGMVRLNILDETVRTLDAMRHVPNFKNDLISLTID